MRIKNFATFVLVVAISFAPIRAEATVYLHLEPFSGSGYVVPASTSKFELKALGALTSQIGKTVFRISNPSGLPITFEWFEGAGYSRQISTTQVTSGQITYVSAPTGTSLYNKLSMTKNDSTSLGSVDVAFFDDADQNGTYSETDKISETRTISWRSVQSISAELSPIQVGDTSLEAKISLPAIFNLEQSDLLGLSLGTSLMSAGQSTFSVEPSTLQTLSKSQNPNSTSPNSTLATLNVAAVQAGSKYKITATLDGISSTSSTQTAVTATASLATKTVIGGVYRKDTVLTKKQSPYLITRTIEVPSGVTFRIEPGVSIYTSQQNVGTAFRVAGRLDVAGVNGTEVLFLAGGQWQPYQWIYQESGTIRINELAVSGGNSFNSGWGTVESITNSEFVNLVGGINDLGNGYQLGEFSSGPTVSGNIFQNSKLEVSGRFTNVSRNLFYGNNSVLTIPRWAQVDSDRNNISDNTILGKVEVYGEGASRWTVNNNCCSYHQSYGRPVNLENNYWGSADEATIRERVIDKDHPSSSISHKGIGDILPVLEEASSATPLFSDKVLPLEITPPVLSYPIMDPIQETATVTWSSLDDELILDYELEYKTSDNQGRWSAWQVEGKYAEPQSVVISMVDRGSIQVRVRANSQYGVVTSNSFTASINRSPRINKWNLERGESSIDGVRLAWTDYYRNWSGGTGDSLVWEITYRQMGILNAAWDTTIATSGETAENANATRNSIWINKLKPSAAYEFKIRAIRNGVKGFWSDTWIRYTQGAKDRFVKIEDSAGNPMAKVSVQWSTTSDYWAEKSEQGKQARGKIVTNANGVVALRRLPAGQYSLRLQGTLPDGTTFLTKQLVAISAVDMVIKMPEPPKMKKVTVYVETPTGMPVAGAVVSLVDKWEQKALDLNSTLREAVYEDPNFDYDEYYANGNWIFKSQGASDAATTTDENGKASFYGFIADETIAKARHEGLSYREVGYSKVMGGLAVVTMDYVPWVEAIPESIEVVSPGQLISVPVALRPESLGDKESTLDDLIAEPDRIRVSIEPPIGVTNKCAVSTSRTVTSGYLDADGNLLLKICPSATGVWKIKTDGAAGGDLIALYVNGTAPSSDFEVNATKTDVALVAEWGTPTKLTGATEVKFTATLYEVKVGKRYKISSVVSLFNSSSFLTSKYKGKVLQVGVIASTRFGKSLEIFSGSTAIPK